MTVGQETPEENFDFRMMIDFWERNTSKPPVDMDRIGTLKIFQHQFTWTVENGSFRDWRPIAFRPCNSADLTAFPAEIYSYVRESMAPDYYCLEEGEYIEMWNNNPYDSAMLQIRLDPCVGDDCYTGEEL